jgi:hypothetical protein
MKRLIDVADKVSDEQSAVRFSLRGASGDLSTCRYHAITSMMQLRSLQSRCWSVGVGLFREVDEVLRVHVRDLTASFVRPCGCVG